MNYLSVYQGNFFSSIDKPNSKKDDEKSSFTVSIHDLPIAFFKLAVDKESTFMLNKRPRVAHTFVEPKHIVTCWRLLLDDLPISNFSILGRVRNHHVITILCHGGSFAGCVMDGDGNVVAHKTFKRYVTRKKQGKRQSNKDKSGHRPRSMGSQIRRKEETLFNNEVQKLIKEWKYYIDDASLIFLHAPGHNRFLICFEDGPLDKNDTRIRNIPFPTHTPTLKGAKEAYNKLTSITISFGNNHLNEEEELQVNEEDVNIL